MFKLIRKIFFLVATLCLVTHAFAVSLELKDQQGNCYYRFNDVHLHATDFYGEGKSLSVIANQADDACVDKILLNPLPVAYNFIRTKLIWNKNSDLPLLKQWRKLTPQFKRRFYFLLNGFDPNDLAAVNYIQEILRTYPDVPIIGVGEIFGEHDKISELTKGGTAKLDAKALQQILQLVASKHWIVLLHNNLGDSVPNGVSESRYLEKLETLLKKNTNIIFVFAHAGISTDVHIANLTKIIQTLLVKYPNLYVDISWLVYDNYILVNNTISRDWVKLIEAYPDRFLFGSDELGGYSGDFHAISKYLPLLRSLTPKTAAKIAAKNFENLMHVVTLK